MSDDFPKVEAVRGADGTLHASQAAATAHEIDVAVENVWKADLHILVRAVLTGEPPRDAPALGPFVSKVENSILHLANAIRARRERTTAEQAKVTAEHVKAWKL